MTRIFSVTVKWCVSITRYLVFLYVKNGEIMHRCPPKFTRGIHHPQCGTAADVPQILTCHAACVCPSAIMRPTGKTSCDARYLIKLQAQCCCSHSSPLTRNKQSNICCHAQHFCWIVDNAKLSLSWHVHHSMPTHLKCGICLPPLHSTNTKHHTWHTSTYEFQQADIAPLSDPEKLLSGPIRTDSPHSPSFEAVL